MDCGFVTINSEDCGFVTINSGWIVVLLLLIEVDVTCKNCLTNKILYGQPTGCHGYHLIMRLAY